MLLTLLIASLAAAAIARGAIELAAWAASDEPYMKVAPFKRRETATLLSLDEYRRLIAVQRIHNEYSRARGHCGQWRV